MSPTIASDPEVALEHHDEQSCGLLELAKSIFFECKENRPLSTLHTAIFLSDQVLNQRLSPHPLRLTYLEQYIRARLTRFTQTGWMEDFDKVLELFAEVLQLRQVATEGDVPGETADVYGTQHLAVECLEEFHQAVHGPSLDTAIHLYHESLSSQPETHSTRFSAMCGLAAALTMRFLLSGRLEDLDQANSLYTVAAQLPSFADHDHKRLHCLTALCAGLMIKIFNSNDLADFRTAIVDMFEADPGYDIGGRGAVLLSTYVGQSGNIDDLNAAMSLLCSALSLRPPGHPRRRSTLINLGAALYTRFKESGNRDDLDEAIARYREVQKITPVGHPFEFEISNNLGTALYKRFEQARDPHDLEDTITCYRNASDLKSGFDVTALGNLGNALVEQGELRDVTEAVSLHRAALDLTSTLHPMRHSMLCNLGSSLVKQYPLCGRLQDLAEAIEILREASDLTPGSHPARHLALSYLAFALHTRHIAAEETNIEDLREAIKLNQKVVASLPANHPELFLSRNLALDLIALHSATNDSAAMDDAMDAFRVAATSDISSVLEQFQTAKVWAGHADGRHPSALEAYNQAISLLPHIVALDTHLEARQTLLSRSKGLASAAASCAIREGKLEKAVEFLDTGRAVFWSQALQLRTPLDDLELKAPALAEKLRRISIELEKGSFRASSGYGAPPQVTMAEEDATRLRHHKNDWNDTVREVRKLDGFEHFLQPIPFVALKQAAALGPVVMLTTSEIGCDALIVTTEGVQHVPVGVFTSEDAEILVHLLQTALSTYQPALSTALQEYLNGLKLRSDDRHGKPSAPAVGLSSDDCLRLILERLWNLIVLPVVTALKLQKSECPRRLWWCPTGPLSHLPIHAAGDYNTKENECLFDYAVSSYTSTLNSLLIQLPQNLSPLKMLVVIEPETPGAFSLPNTTVELQKIKSHIPEECLIELGAVDSPSSINKVLFHLSEVSMVHFACHGTQNHDNPLDSALLLTDGPMKISQIMKAPLVNASLAFLSACETAIGSKNVPDESIHIAAAMLFAGFHGVVGTLWSIADKDAPFVADSYYQHLFNAGSGSHPDPHNAAWALHLAVRKLQQLPGCSLQRWVPFIHIGI